MGFADIDKIAHICFLRHFIFETINSINKIRKCLDDFIQPLNKGVCYG